MNKNTNEKIRVFVLISTTVILLGLWSYYKDYIRNEQMIGFLGDRRHNKPPKLESYPKVSADNIYYSKQKVEFSFNCTGSEAGRWMLHITGTAFEDNFGTMEITIDDATTKKFRTFAFKHYRYTYLVHFDKLSQTLFDKVHVEFKFSGKKSNPLFEMPLLELVPEKIRYLDLPPFTIIPTTFKRYSPSGNCKLEKSELSVTG